MLYSLLMKNVLILNCGSSSIKYAVIDADTYETAHNGLVERVKHDQYRSILDETIGSLKSQFPKGFRAIGHRVVHGGEAFTESTIINDDVIKTIEKCNKVAPLHNPNNIEGIKAAEAAFPDLPQIAVFDTAFHQTLPDYAYIYPVPYDWYQKHQVRRYGFHGTSHRYVALEAAKKLNKNISECSLLTAHLGNGCSATAIKNGKSVDTTMGLTPLEGLMMGTRSGDIDPGLHEYLTHELNCNVHELTNMLNKKSGLLGVSGVSNDMREIHKAIEKNNRLAKLALEIFCFRLAKHLSALAVSLQKLDALIFTGGIGENDQIVRKKTCKWLNMLNLYCDDEANKIHGKKTNGLISTKESTPIFVIRTDEEVMIAKDCIGLA